MVTEDIEDLVNLLCGIKKMCLHLNSWLKFTIVAVSDYNQHLPLGNDTVNEDVTKLVKQVNDARSESVAC